MIIDKIIMIILMLPFAIASIATSIVEYKDKKRFMLALSKMDKKKNVESN